MIIQLAPKTGYIQCVRMRENEDVLEAFYRHWKERTSNIIIQKYDSFSLFLPENSVTDISPLKRNCCWHLKRELTILLDGTVPLCREDLNKSIVMGNMFSDPIEDIWNRGKEVFALHQRKEYPKICENCDEYYTYNF